MRNLPAILMLAVAAPGFSQSLASPEVHSDSRVTFRLRAPNAQEVKVRLETVGTQPMQKDEQGVWSFTTESLKPRSQGHSGPGRGHLVIGGQCEW